MLVLVNKPTMAQFYVEEIPDAAWDIMEVADTPTTIILDSAKTSQKTLLLLMVVLVLELLLRNFRIN